VKLIVDRREPEDFRRVLMALGFKPKKLKTADIIVGNVLFERKEIKQFVTDWFSHQLDNQLANMFEQKRIPVLIVEGTLSSVPQHMGRVEGHLKDLNRKIIVERTGDMRGTITLITEYVEEMREGTLFLHKRPVIVNPSKGTSEDTMAISMLARMPGVGEGRAIAILKHYKTVWNALKHIGLWGKKVDGIGLKTQAGARAILHREVRL